MTATDGALERRRDLRGLGWMTGLFIAAYVALGLAIGTARGEGLGFGDTRTADATVPEAVGSAFGSLWRIVVSLAVLALLPVAWHAFLARLGSFGHRVGSSPPSEQDQLRSLAADEDDLPGAHRLAWSSSRSCLVVLLAFGNCFLPYVLVRWGWGPVR